MYVDPTIGNVAKLLVPTYPTYHLPNQMIRMIPISDNYIDDQITAFPLQVTEHRSLGIMRMRLSTGEVTPGAWERRMTRDQDLEVRRPWQYSTYLIDDDITVGFVPGQQCAMYKIEFPGGPAQEPVDSWRRSHAGSRLGRVAFQPARDLQVHHAGHGSGDAGYGDLLLRRTHGRRRRSSGGDHL